MKIVFVGTLYAPNGVGGAERTVQTIAEMAVRLGHEVAVISLAPDGVARSGELNGVRTHYVPLANIHFPVGPLRSAPRRALWHAIDAYNPWMARRVGRLLDQEQPDVVQTGNLLGFSAAVWQAAHRRGIPVVQMLHDYYMGCANSSMFKRGTNCQRQCTSCRVFTWPRRAMSDTPRAVISLSARLLERVEGTGMFPRVGKKLVIHGASDLQPQPDAQRPGGAGLTVGYLGRLESTKGLEFMLDGLAQVPDVQVLLAGKGEDDYVQGLKQRYAGARHIEFLGFTKPQELFARIDLLLVPSMWEEPLGRVIYEAYTYGIASIVSRGGGMPEIVEEGRTGYVVAPGDSAALAALVRRLAHDWDRAAFRAACLEKSREFQIENLIDDYLGVWSHAIAASPSRPAGRQLRPARAVCEQAATWMFVDDTGFFGGHEAMVLRWLEELDKFPGLVTPRLLARAGGRLLAQAPEPMRCTPLVVQPSGSVWARWRASWRKLRTLRQTVRTLAPECVVVASGALHHQMFSVLMLRLMGARVLLYVPLLGTFASMGYHMGAWKDRFVRWFYAKVPRGWIAITQAQADEFRAWARPTAPVFVLPNTVASSIEQAPRVQLRTLAPGQPLRVLVLGRLEPHQKGLDMLLAYLQQLGPTELEGLHFRFVGDGSYKPQIDAVLAAQPWVARHIELQAWTPAQAAIEDSDVVLLPSRYEGVPLVMLEAMALGVPVVSADLPGTNPYVPSATRFAVGDMRAALAIVRGLRPLARRESIAQAGRARFEAQASGQAFAGHVRELVRAVRTHFAIATPTSHHQGSVPTDS